MCCLAWNNCGFTKLFQIFQALCFTIFYLVLEAITLAIILSLSIGIASLVSFIHEIVVANPLSSNYHAIISMLCATMLGEFAKLCQQDTSFQGIIRNQETKHPFIVGKIPSIVAYFLGILGFGELYIQYKIAHPSRYFNTGIVDSSEFDPNYDPESLDPTSTWIFLLSLCYISYSVVRGSDWMRYRLRITAAEREQITGKCTTYAMFIIIQVFLLIIYAIPIYFVTLFCRATSVRPNLIFFVLNLIGLVLGANAAQLESLYPFPRVQLLPPGYEYENHLSSRVQVLLIFLFPLICTAYYGPEDLFTSLPAGDKFLIFCLITSITLLQITKVLLDFRFIDGIHQFRGMRINREIGPNPDLEAGNEEVQNVEVAIEVVPNVPAESSSANKESSSKAEEQEAEQDHVNENDNNNANKNKKEFIEDRELKIVEIKSPPNIVVPEQVIIKVENEAVQNELNKNQIESPTVDETTNENQNEQTNSEKNK